MIILEGPDGAGKTTLAQELCRHFQLGYEHSGPPSATEDLFRTYQARLHNAEPRTLFDRLFHGETVYGPLVRGKSRLTETQVQYLELEAATAGVMVVWCYAAPDVLASRGDPIYKTVPAASLLQGYWDQIKLSRLPSFLYHSGLHQPSYVVRFLEQAGYEPRKWPWPHKGVGNPNAKVALVGDRYPDKVSDWSALPHWRPFDNSRSGSYLLTALRALERYSPQGFYLTNAVKQQGGNLLEELRSFNRIVCLGVEAERAVRTTFSDMARFDGPVPEITRVPHPQFWSRFYHHNPESYTAQLKAAMGW